LTLASAASSRPCKHDANKWCFPGYATLGAVSSWPSGPRFIICGEDNLALRLVFELVSIHDCSVTAIVRSPDAPVVRQIAAMDRVHLVVCGQLDRDAFERAELGLAATVALVEQSDGTNVDAALLAHELAPHVRIVMRIFDETIAESMRDILADCAVLSATAVAAPAFVDAAVGGHLPSPVHLGDRTLYVTERSHTAPEDVICELAVITDAEPRLLPAPDTPATIVLASQVRGRIAPDSSSDRLAELATQGRRHRRRARLRSFRAIATLVLKRLRTVLMSVVAFLAVAATLLVVVKQIAWSSALYVATLTTFSGGDANLGNSPAERALQISMTIAGLALIPTITATIVEAAVTARLAVSTGGLAVPLEGHLVVVGLGDVGTRVLTALDDLGIAVVGIERDQHARGVEIARQRRIPVISGDAKREATLRAAGAHSATGLLALTSKDITNLETALFGHKLNDKMHTVLRLFDGEFAERVQRNFGFTTSRSVSQLAAPTFAAAMMGREVVATIPIRRRVLIAAELTVCAGSELEGKSVAEVFREGSYRIIAIRTGDGDEFRWQPAPGRQLQRTDQVIALATRAGLGQLIAQARPADGSIVAHDVDSPAFES
jgi:Trk K+ transport system NAD-binding subunit